MDSQLHCAVVGCGYWGPNLVRNFNSLDGCHVSHVCDSDQARLAHMKDLYPHLHTTSEFDDIVNNHSIDAVAIATPVTTHHELARRCLLAGKHVFIEKPMARSSAECEELIALAGHRNLCVMVGHTFLYSAPVRAIRDIVLSEELGEMLYVSSRRLNLGLFQKDINVTWDLAPHDISIILFVLNDAPAWVSCQGKAGIRDGTEDVTSMTFMSRKGVFVIIQNSWLDPNKIREITFVGKRKMLNYNDLEPTEIIKIYDKRVEAPPHYDNFGEFRYSYHYGDMHAPYVKQVEPLKVECRHFLECVRTGASPLSDGWNGLQVVRVLEAASQSLNTGGIRVELPPLSMPADPSSSRAMHAAGSALS